MNRLYEITCYRCHESKPYSSYREVEKKTNNICIECQSKYHKKWYEENKEKRKKQVSIYKKNKVFSDDQVKIKELEKEINKSKNELNKKNEKLIEAEKKITELNYTINTSEEIQKGQKMIGDLNYEISEKVEKSLLKNKNLVSIYEAYGRHHNKFHIFFEKHKYSFVEKIHINTKKAIEKTEWYLKNKKDHIEIFRNIFPKIDEKIIEKINEKSNLGFPPSTNELADEVKDLVNYILFSTFLNEQFFCKLNIIDIVFEKTLEVYREKEKKLKEKEKELYLKFEKIEKNIRKKLKNFAKWEDGDYEKKSKEYSETIKTYKDLYDRLYIKEKEVAKLYNHWLKMCRSKEIAKYSDCQKIKELEKIKYLKKYEINRDIGIYFLIDNSEIKNKIVYVGQSKTSIYSRLKQHLKEKVFTDVYFLEIPENEIDAKELYYIKKLRPKYNVVGKPKS